MAKDQPQVNQKPNSAQSITTDTLLLLIGIKEVEIYHLKQQLIQKNPAQFKAPRPDEAPLAAGTTSVAEILRREKETQ